MILEESLYIYDGGQDGSTPLHRAAAEKGHLPVVKELLDRGAQIDKETKVSSRSS